MNQEDCKKELIFYGGDFNYEKCERNFGQYFLSSMERNRTKIALIDPINGITYTHGDVRTLSIRCALEMKRRNIKKGDIVTIIGRNHNINLILPFLSGIYLGAIVNPLHPDYSYDDIKRMIGLTTPQIIFCDEECSATIKLILSKLKLLACEIVIFEKDFVPFIVSHDEIEETQFVTTIVDVDNDLISIVCTSGTTGFIKGTMVTHQTYYHTTSTYSNAINPNEIILTYSPLSWLTSLWAYAVIFFVGAARLIVEYNVDKNLEIMSKYKIHWILFGPDKITEMIRHPNFFKYPEIVENLKYIFFGGVKIPNEQILEYRRIFKNATFVHLYGSTELYTSHARFIPNRDKDLMNKKIYSNGKPPPGVYWKVIDPEAGNTVGRNQCGELLIKGPTLTKGYFKDPDATAKAIDKEGWFHTGDIVEIDDDDCLHVVGRNKEILKYRGWQISTVELEQIIESHPSVARVCVIGKQHETDGEIPIAFVVRKISVQNLTEQDIVNYVNERVNDAKKLRGGVIFIDEIPVTPSGKVRICELQQLISLN